MTRKEAIEILNRDDDSMRKGYFCTNDFLAIEALKSEEPILDKIRAEIEQTVSRYSISRERGGMGQVEWSDRLIKESEVLQIIDKYKAESEEKE